MANTSIFAAFERMWHHIVIALSNKANTDHDHEGQSVRPAFVEFAPPTNGNHGGHIDFHYNGDDADYTARIIENTRGSLTVFGNCGLAVVGGAHMAYTNLSNGETGFTRLHNGHMAIGYDFDNSLKIDASGNIKVPSSNYGTSLPDAGNAGRIFFKKV